MRIGIDCVYHGRLLYLSGGGEVSSSGELAGDCDEPDGLASSSGYTGDVGE